MQTGSEVCKCNYKKTVDGCGVTGGTTSRTTSDAGRGSRACSAPREEENEEESFVVEATAVVAEPPEASNLGTQPALPPARR